MKQNEKIIFWVKQEIQYNLVIAERQQKVGGREKKEVGEEKEKDIEKIQYSENLNHVFMRQLNPAWKIIQHNQLIQRR